MFTLSQSEVQPGFISRLRKVLELLVSGQLVLWWANVAELLCSASTNQRTLLQQLTSAAIFRELGWSAFFTTQPSIGLLLVALSLSKAAAAGSELRSTKHARADAMPFSCCGSCIPLFSQRLL